MRSLSMLLGVLMALTATSVPAANVSITAGPSVTSSNRWTHAVFVNVAADARDWRGYRLQPMATVGWIDRRSTRKDDLNHNVRVVGAGLRANRLWRRLFVSFQVAHTDSRTDALSSDTAFITSVGWTGDHWLALVRHISNGHIFPGKNLGETMFMVGLRF